MVASAQFLIDSESALNAGMMRFAPTEAARHGAGVLVALDPETRRARIAHDAIEALDWPAMETVFTSGRMWRWRAGARRRGGFEMCAGPTA